MKPFLRSISMGVALLVSGFVARDAAAVTNNTCNFADLTAFKVNGNAAQIPGNILRLTPNQNNRVGSAFLTAPVAFPAGVSFHTFLHISIAPNANGADGIAFILQSSAAGAAAIGANGGALGYGGITPSVVVEFDTYLNGWDPNANHVGLMLNGDNTNHVAVGTPAFALANGVTYAWIDYDGTAKSLSTYVSQTTTKPAAALFTHAIDLNTILGPSVFVGFSAATGGSTNNQDILAWEFSTDGVPCGCEGEPACGGADPICGTAGLCVDCTSDANCKQPKPRCDTAITTCVQCLTGADCGGDTPVCDAATHGCKACASDADCGGTTPACQTSGACGQCSPTNTKQCLAPDKVCDAPTGTCVGCETNADCAGSSPICTKATHTCGACKVDADCAGNPAGNACATTGMKVGQCVPCTSNATCAAPTPACDVVSNQCVGCEANTDCTTPAAPVCNVAANQCVGCLANTDCTTPAAPVCITTSDACGCGMDSDCAKDTYCNKVVVTTGTCTTGCVVTGGVSNCNTGEVCSVQNGSVGVCQPAGTTTSSSTGTGGSTSSQGGASSSSQGGASSSSQGGASSSSQGGAGQGGTGQGGAGGNGQGGAGNGGTNANGAGAGTSANVSGSASAGQGGAGNASGQGGNAVNADDNGVVALGAGCACGVAGHDGGSEGGLAGVLLALGMVSAARRRQRAASR